MIVAGEAEDAAMFRRAGGIAVLQHVAGAVDARTLAVPDADHAVLARAGRQADLLRAPDGGRGEVLVDARLEDDVVRVEIGLGLQKLLVVAAERRAAIARDEGGGIRDRRRGRAASAPSADAPAPAGRS